MRLGLSRLGLGRLSLGRLGLGRLGLGRLGLGRLGLGRLAFGFRPRLSLPAAGVIFLVGLLQRDLLLYCLLLTRRFLISPFLAGRLVIGGPRRSGAVER